MRTGMRSYHGKILFSPDENPGEKPADKPADAPADNPAKDPAKPVADVADSPDGKPADKAGTPAKVGTLLDDDEPPADKTDEKPADAADKKDGAGVPAKYELSLPEGSPLTADAIESVSAYARENGLSNAQAQKALELLNTETAAREASYLESIKRGGAEWTRRVAGYNEAAMADKEIGGSVDVLKQNASLAKKVISEHFDPEVLEYLKETGMGSHPAIIKGFAKIAKMVSEGTPPSPRIDPLQPAKPSAAKSIYPDLPSEAEAGSTPRS